MPGDVCEGGWLPPKVEVPCPAHSPVSRGGKISLLLLLAVVVLMFVFNQLAKSGKLKALLRNSGDIDCVAVGSQEGVADKLAVAGHGETGSFPCVKLGPISFKWMSLAASVVHSLARCVALRI